MAYKPTEDTTQDVRERAYLPELLRGLAITTRHFLRNLFGERDTNASVLDRKGTNQVSTVEYPEERVAYPEGYRGLHRLVPREDGKPRCVACYMCATVCPAQCIYIEAAEYPDDDASAASRVIEKYPKAFVIDELRCIVCGLCVEACPKDAIRMDTYRHVDSEYTRQGFVYGIPKLLNGPPAAHPSDPWTHRSSSEAPEHVHKEAHTRVGEGADSQGGHHSHLHALSNGGTERRVEVTNQPIPVTKFLK